MYGFCTDDERVRVDALLGKKLLREENVLAGVRWNSVLDQYLLRRDAHPYGDFGELIGLRLVPQSVW